MKKSIISVFLCIVLMLSLLPDTVHAASIRDVELNKKSITLYLNEDNKTDTKNSYQISLRNKPRDYNDYRYEWTIEDTSVVDIQKKLSTNLTIVAKKVGTTRITCTIKNSDGTREVHTCSGKVNVMENAKTVTNN